MGAGEVERESMSYDVVIVGAGPAGLAAAIRLKQLATAGGRDVSVCVLEKGSEVGAHIVSGAVFEPRALDELMPAWRDMDAPIKTAVSSERFMVLRESGGFSIPNFLLPSSMRNHGNYIVSLGDVCRWLGARAEELGVEIYPGFPASDLVLAEDGRVCGVVTGDLGVARDGSHKSSYSPGMELLGSYTLFAEGCRGHLGERLKKAFGLATDAQPQTYGLGLKELWEVDPAQHREGLVAHSAGWPLPRDVYGGSFQYHLHDNQVAIGFVVALDYDNPYLSPYEEFQRFKQHPMVRPVLEGGRRIGYGARAINEGGWQSLPKVAFPGGALIGCDAGTLNVAKIKGSHTAMKSGMLAAEAVFAALADDQVAPVLAAYETALRTSWVATELQAARNFRPGFKHGLLKGTILAGIDQKLLRGRAPWTMQHDGADHTHLSGKDDYAPITYPRPDGVVSFDRLSSVQLANTNHEEDQPVHLRLRDDEVPVAVNLARFDAPEQRYCPAGVYEILTADDGSSPRLVINAQNCVHCKTCDIKDPTQNIEWVAPEGGGGPNYSSM